MEALVKELRGVLERKQVVDDDVDIRRILETYSADDWKDYEHWLRGRPDIKYTRNLVDTVDGKCNVIVLCWKPDKGCKIHSHTGTSCFVKVLSGTLSETRYGWPREPHAPLVETEKYTYGPGDVCYINDDLGIHLMENPSDSEGTVSLHLYIPPFASCKTFDKEIGETGTSPMTFHSVGGKLIYKAPI